MEEKAQAKGGRERELSGIWRIATKVMLSLYPIVGVVYLFSLPALFGIGAYRQQYFGIFFALTYASGFLLIPATKKAARGSVPWYDAVLAFLSLIPPLYLTFFYPQLIRSVGSLGLITPPRLVLGTMMILFSLELTRRTMGWTVVITALVFLVYTQFSNFLPGILSGRPFAWERVVLFSYLDSNAMLGLIATVMMGVIFGFIFFGNALFAAGGGALLTDVAIAGFGRFRGGPAKVSVVSSSLFGTISGSVLANITFTGQVTIPLMKRTGYKPQEAAAVEAVASSGGQIMPPVMGSSAFLAAVLLGIAYRNIALAAFLPAFLYYFVAFMQVDLVAAKNGLKGIPVAQLPSLRKALANWYLFVVPLAVLVYYLFLAGLEAEIAAMYAVGSIVLVSMFRKGTRLTPSRFLGILELTGRGMIEMVVMVGSIGTIMGVINLTGLGISFSQMLVSISGGNFLVLLVITAVASIILGTGLPVGPAYLLLALLAAPALIGMGANPVAVHLFLIYFAVMSFITPPVCLGVYVAASIGGAPSMKTAWEAIKIGMVGYIVPVLFVFSPALLLVGSVGEIVLITLTLMLGFFGFSIGVQGYLFRNISGSVRGLFLIAGIGLFIPHFWPANVGGAVLTILLLVQEWRMRKATRLMEVA